MIKLLNVLKVVLSVATILFSVLVAIDGFIALDYDTALAMVLFVLTIALIVASIIQIKFRNKSSFSIFVPSVIYVISCFVSIFTLGNISDGTLIAVICGVISGLSIILSIPAVIRK